MPLAFFCLRRSYLDFSILVFIATLSLKPNTKLKYFGPLSSFRRTNMYVVSREASRPHSAHRH